MSTTTEARTLGMQAQGNYFLRPGGTDRGLRNIDPNHEINERWLMQIRRWDGRWYQLGFSCDENDGAAECGFAVQKRLAGRQLVAWPPESYGPFLEDTVPLVTSRPVEKIEWQDAASRSALLKNGVEIAYVHATGPASNLPMGCDWEYAALNTESIN